MKRPGDFTADSRLLYISALALVIGAVASVAAMLLLHLITLFTNLFYFQRFSFQAHSPSESTLGWVAVLLPVLGGLVIGLMARYGSDRIRGHGIPEAMEAILIGRSRMQIKVALLKPISSAISIGSGGPFGAEGPIIMTGGAIGSILAQAFHLTSSERKTLLVAGAAAGMSATFSTPLAAVLLAVELLLFEWKPRSLIPVALASSLAAMLRPLILGPGPLFAVALHGPLPLTAYPSAFVVGIAAGLFSILLTASVYAAEDAFQRLPLHWMWWPAIGGLVVGLGGLLSPRALGVGYDVIADLLRGQTVPSALALLMVVKGTIWAIALGSGTSGGVLAPLLMMGGALGALESHILPGADPAMWALVSMAAVLGGTMRSPLTGVAFALELTHDVSLVPVLLVAAITADAITVLLLKRSILTEKVARRGHHVSREYSVDPLELIHLRDVMTCEVETLAATGTVAEVLRQLGGAPKHQGYPVVDVENRLLGVVTRSDLLEQLVDESGEPTEGPIITADLIERRPIVAYADESCRTAAERMAESHVGRLPVLSNEAPHRLIGIVTRSDSLKARAHHLDEEATRERYIGRGASQKN